MISGAIFGVGALVAANDLRAQTMTAGVIMQKMQGGDRYTYVAGIVEGLAHSRFVKDSKDPKGRACIYEWFFEDKATIQKIYAAFEKIPGCNARRGSRRVSCYEMRGLMDTLPQKSARFEFARRAEISADLRQRLLLEMNTRVRTEQDKTARETERRRDAEFVMALQGALAPPQKIAEFTVKLDRYDTATVQALMDNERDILDVRERIDGMLLKAHVVNGRRVFKTEDGNRVFDEFGSELKADEITPDAIDNAKPRWEVFSAARDEEKRLVQERKDLGDYQDKLDRARERTKDPKLTEDELSALDKELGETMPDRVRKLTGEQKPDQQRTLAADAVLDNAPPGTDPNRAAMAPATFQP